MAGARPDAAAERLFRFELAAHPGSVAHARRLTRARLSGWALCEDTCDTAALVVSELVTNAIVHAAGRRVVCELLDGDDLVRIAVRDEGCAPGEPHPSPQRPEEEHGRGLLLVEAMCLAWGAQESGPGLLVWANLPRGVRASHTGDDSDGASCPAEPTASAASTRRLNTVPRMADGHYRDDGHHEDDDRHRHDGRHQDDDRHRHDGRHQDTAVRSDLGWSAKKPPAEDRGNGAETSRGAEAVGVPPLGRSREWGSV